MCVYCPYSALPHSSSVLALQLSSTRDQVCAQGWVFLRSQGLAPPTHRAVYTMLMQCHVLCWFVLPICFTHGLALLSPYYTSSTCVCSVIFSLQVVWVCCVATSDPRCFLPVTMCGTTHAHLVHMCLHRWRVPQFALKYPCNPPPPPLGDRHLATVSPPHPGDCRALTREFARGGGAGQLEKHGGDGLPGGGGEMQGGGCLQGGGGTIMEAHVVYL